METSKLCLFLILVTDKTLSVGVVGVTNIFALEVASFERMVTFVLFALKVAEPIDAARVADELAIGVLEMVNLLVLTSGAITLPRLVILPEASIITLPSNISTFWASQLFCRNNVPMTLSSEPFSIESVPLTVNWPATIVSPIVVSPKTLK